MITLGGFNLPLQFPVEGNEGMLETFLKMFDGQANSIGATATVVPGGMTNFWSWDATAGSILTLPTAIGSLMRVFAFVKVLATTNSHIMKTSPATDTFQGLIAGMSSNNTVLAFPGVAGGSNSNTITLNRSTTGSVQIGEWVEAIDTSSGIWTVRGFLASTGTFATPFSHV